MITFDDKSLINKTRKDIFEMEIKQICFITTSRCDAPNLYFHDCNMSITSLSEKDCSIETNYVYIIIIVICVIANLMIIIGVAFKYIREIILDEQYIGVELPPELISYNVREEICDHLYEEITEETRKSWWNTLNWFEIK